MDNTSTYTGDPIVIRPEAPAKKQGGKILALVLLALIIGAGAATAVFVTINGGFDFGKTASTSGDGSSSNSSASGDSGSSTPSTNIPDGEIADAKLIHRLAYKANRILAGQLTAERFTEDWDYLSKFDDYKQLSNDFKTNRILMTYTRSEATKFKVADIPDKYELKKNATNNGFTELEGFYITDTIKSDYKDMFGAELTHFPEKIAASFKLGCDFYYISELNAYITPGQCGGASDFALLSYQYKYTKEGDKAYVYFALGSAKGTMNGWEYYNDMDGKTKVDTTSMIIDSENYAQYAHYRAIFEKGSDGDYYYQTLEKVTD